MQNTFKSRFDRLSRSLAITFALFSSLALNAEVLKESPNSFDLTYEVKVNAGLGKLTSTFENINSWWHPDHTYSGKSENLTLDRNRNCFCEVLENGGFVKHLDWVFYQPGKKARFVGGLGPLQTVPVDGVLTFDFKVGEKNTSLLTVTYSVISSEERLKGWSSAVNNVLGEQIKRLKNEVEK